MTLYELCENIELQGNIEVKVFATDGTETQTYLFPDEWGFHITFTNPEIEDYEVGYIYTSTGRNKTHWLTIEVTKEDEE